MKTPGPFVPLDVSYYDDAKILAVSEAAELAYLRGLATCKRLFSPGVLLHAHVERMGLGDIHDRASELVKAGLWERVEDGYLICGWAKWNPASDEVETARRGRRQAAAATNHSVWCVGRGMIRPNCLICHGDRTVNAQSESEVRVTIKSESESGTVGSDRTVSRNGGPYDGPSDDDERGARDRPATPAAGRETDERYSATLTLLANNRMAAVGTKIDKPTAYRQKVLANISGGPLPDQLSALMAARPDYTPDQLAKELEAESQPIGDTVPLSESRNPAVVAERRREAHKGETVDDTGATSETNVARLAELAKGF